MVIPSATIPTNAKITFGRLPQGFCSFPIMWWILSHSPEKISFRNSMAVGQSNRECFSGRPARG
jgi:hypothetical protein